MTEALNQWVVTKEVRGPWGNDRGTATYEEVVDADEIKFEPGHVVFYDGMGMIVKAIRNSEVLDVRDTTYDKVEGDEEEPT